MVSLAIEQWPDTVLPPSSTAIGIVKGSELILRVAPQHLFHAWGQISLVLATMECQSVCHFNDKPVQKTLVYGGGHTMPLRIHEKVARSNVRGFMRHSDEALDVICTAPDPNFHCPTGWRVAPSQIIAIEIRTAKGCLLLESEPSTAKSIDWFGLAVADELSCWLWSVSPKQNTRRVNLIDVSSMLTENMKNIIN